MRILDALETSRLLPYAELLGEIQAVLKNKKAGRARAPERLVMELPAGGSLLLMPAVDDQLAITKLVTVHPKKRSSVKAEVWVMSAHTGERIALLDGAAVTARRTAAVSLLAAKLLAPNRDGPLLVVGSGVQAKAHLEAFHDALGISEVYVCSRSSQNAARLADYATSLGLKALVIGNPAEVSGKVTLVVTATTSSSPVIPDNLRSTAFVAAVGAFRPDMAELPTGLIGRASLFVDSLEGAKAEAGDLIQASVDWSRVTPLENVIKGARPQKGPVVFKSVGHALWDLAACRLAVRKLSHT